MSEILLYGANGYTGRIIAEMARARGVELTLAGRNKPAIEQMSAELNYPHRIFALNDPSAVEEGLSGMHTVLHCAGPFSRTAEPMAKAAIKTGCHYLDITGEIAVFEHLKHKLGADAKAAGVMLMPGVGFDVVPSDCLARFLADACPDATELTLAFTGGGGVSHGTATTAVENIDQGGAIRRDGKIVSVPSAHHSRMFDFGRGPRWAVSIPWGDVSTAWHSTGIENITVYMATPPAMQKLMVASRYLGWALGSGVGQWALKSMLPATGPTPEAREKGWAVVVGEATAQNGEKVAARLTCPEAYTLTAMTGLHIALICKNGSFKAGYQTPSSAYGPELILQIEGVTRDVIEQP